MCQALECLNCLTAPCPNNRAPCHTARFPGRAGEDVPVNELLRFSKLFNDELTLDNLER